MCVCVCGGPPHLISNILMLMIIVSWITNFSAVHNLSIYQKKVPKFKSLLAGPLSQSNLACLIFWSVHCFICSRCFDAVNIFRQSMFWCGRYFRYLREFCSSSQLMLQCCQCTFYSHLYTLKRLLFCIRI